MDYIVMDLEWNQNPYGKSKNHPDMPFEIIEIGAVKAMLQIKDIMMKFEKIKTSAKNNTEKDFEFAYFDNIDDALIEGLEQNQDFFSLLLGNEEMKKRVLGIFLEEIYNSLKDV